MGARTGVTHYAWPGGLAMVIETPGSGVAAVWQPDGWRIGPADEIFARSPSGAEEIHLALPESLAHELAALRLVGSSLHTDFVYLDRLVNTLAAEGTDAALFVLGRAPAALVLSGERVTLIEPAPSAHEPVEEVLTGADGWIVMGLGKVQVPRPTAGTSVRGTEPAPGSKTAPTEPKPIVAQNAAADATNAVASQAPARAPASDAGAFGRFAGDARFVLAHDAAQRMSAEASAKIVEAAGDAMPAALALFDGTHTLMQIAAATGLGPVAVTAIVEILVAHRLVFRYVSRVRPPTSASTSG